MPISALGPTSPAMVRGNCKLGSPTTAGSEWRQIRSLHVNGEILLIGKQFFATTGRIDNHGFTNIITVPLYKVPLAGLSRIGEFIINGLLVDSARRVESGVGYHMEIVEIWETGPADNLTYQVILELTHLVPRPPR